MSYQEIALTIIWISFLACAAYLAAFGWVQLYRWINGAEDAGRMWGRHALISVAGLMLVVITLITGAAIIGALL